MEWLSQALDLFIKGKRFQIEVSKGKEQNFAEMYLASSGYRYSCEESSSNTITFHQRE